jgi:hypothetical protein
VNADLRLGAVRAGPGEGTTHVLQFGPFCGETLLDRLRGFGLLVLMTAAEYRSGAVNMNKDWAEERRKGASEKELAAWASARVGYPVTVTRVDELADPGWAGSIAYRVSRATL